MAFTDRMKEARLAAGITQEKLAQQIGVAKSTYTGYEKGNSEPNILMQTKIMDALGVDANYLFQDEIKQRQDRVASPWEMEHIVKKYRNLDLHGKNTVMAVLDCETVRCQESLQALTVNDEPAPVEYIRHYLTAAAAGYAAPIEGEDYELIPRGKDIPAKADFCIDIDGDSMEPYIKNHQRVYVQRDTELHEFDVGIFFVDGDVYCKQWCIDYAGTLHLLSANPKRENANIQVHRDSVRNVVCFGKVLLPKKLPRPIYR